VCQGKKLTDSNIVNRQLNTIPTQMERLSYVKSIEISSDSYRADFCSDLTLERCMDRENFICYFHPFIRSVENCIIRAFSGYPTNLLDQVYIHDIFYHIDQTDNIVPEDFIPGDIIAGNSSNDNRIHACLVNFYSQIMKIDHLDNSICKLLQLSYPLTSNKLLHRCISDVGNGFVSQINPARIKLPEWVTSDEYVEFLKSYSYELLSLCDSVEEIMESIQVFPIDDPGAVVEYFLEDEILNSIKYIRIMIEKGFTDGVFEICEIQKDFEKKREMLFASVSRKVKVAVDNSLIYRRAKPSISYRHYSINVNQNLILRNCHTFWL
jgi:hypothetical protein